MLADTPLTHIPLLSDTAITLLMFCIGAGLGARLLRILRVPIQEPLERGVFATALGLGTLSYVPFLLFSVGIGTPVTISCATLALFLLLLLVTAAAAAGVSD